MPSELKFGTAANATATAAGPGPSPKVVLTPRATATALSHPTPPVRKFDTVVEPKMVEIKPEAPLAATTIQYAANPAPAPKRIIVVPESTLREMNCGRETLIKMHGYKGI